jgi:hypothetical protein
MGKKDNAPENAGPKAGGRWRPGQSGNPAGKRKGCKHRATQLAEQMIGEEAEQILRKIIDSALAGDATCLRLCMERIAPPVKERRLSLELPEIQEAADGVAVMEALLSAVAQGNITPGEGVSVASLVEAYRRMVETQDLEQRLRALEDRMEVNNGTT